MPTITVSSSTMPACYWGRDINKAAELWQTLLDEDATACCLLELDNVYCLVSRPLLDSTTDRYRQKIKTAADWLQRTVR